MVVETTKGWMMPRLYHILSQGGVALSKKCGRLDTSFFSLWLTKLSNKNFHSNKFFVERNRIKCNVIIFRAGLFILGALAKLRKATIRFVMSVCPSVCPHRTTRLPLDGFSCNLISRFVDRASCNDSW